MVWLIGRTQTNGPKDYAAVHAIQKQYKLVPLSAFGKPYTAPPGQVDPTLDMKKAPIEAVAAMGTTVYFNVMAALMKDNPPAKADAPMVEKMAKIGIVPGKDFDPSANLILRLLKACRAFRGGLPKKRSWAISNRPSSMRGKRLASHDEDWNLWYGLPPTCFCHRNWPRSQPTSRCCIPPDLSG